MSLGGRDTGAVMATAHSCWRQYVVCIGARSRRGRKPPVQTEYRDSENGRHHCSASPVVPTNPCGSMNGQRSHLGQFSTKLTRLTQGINFHRGTWFARPPDFG